MESSHNPSGIHGVANDSLKIGESPFQLLF